MLVSNARHAHMGVCGAIAKNALVVFMDEIEISAWNAALVHMGA